MTGKLFDDPAPAKTAWQRYEEECRATAALFPAPPAAPENERRKAKGQARALTGSDPDWRLAAGRWLQTLPRGHQFTSEDLVAACGLPRGAIGTNQNNAVGALISGYARRGVIRDTGRWIKSQRASSHAAKLTVWEA
jgi:hypothetical protein